MVAEGPPGRGALTAREREVLLLLCRGLSNKQIARSLGISKHTVKAHLVNIYAALQVDGRTAAAMRAVGDGYCEVER